VDGAQWRALVRAYLVMDLRAGGGPQGPAARKRRLSGSIPYVGLLIMTAVASLLIAVVAARIPDLLAAATMVTMYGAANTAMLLLVDFAAFVISPTDYAVLGHQPVSSRTYFAARVTSVLIYVGAVALVTQSSRRLRLACGKPSAS
jgi:ABC-2 type transport system permease protein